MKKITIAIPTYNRCEYLKKQIDFLIQDGILTMLNDVEFIVSNNNSTDSTFEYLEGVRKKHPSIIINHNIENKGLIGNFQKIYELATGEYIWMVGDDDILEPGILEALLHMLWKYDDVTWVYLKHNRLKKNNITTHNDLNVPEYDEMGIRLFSKIASSNYKIGALMFITASVMRTELVREAFNIFKNSYEYEIKNLTIPLGLSYYCALSGPGAVILQVYLTDNIANTISWSQHIKRVFFRDQVAILDLMAQSKGVKLINTLEFPNCLEFPFPEWKYLKAHSKEDNYIMSFYLKYKPQQIILDFIDLCVDKLKRIIKK